MPAPARPIQLLRELAALAAVLLVSATVATATIPHDGDPAPGHRCIHDEIRAKQFDGQSLHAALATGRFSAAAELLLPRGGITRASSGGYEPIRFKVYTEDVYDSSKYCTAAGQVRPNFQGSTLQCTANDVLTSSKQQLLVNTMIPAAVQMHSERLSVQPIGRLSIPTMTGGICGSFTVPTSVLKNGVSDADFVLFVAAGPVDGPTVAWATTCLFVSGTNRPVVGVINVKPQYIDGTDQSIRTVAHEIMHALGFSGPQFQAHDMVAVVEDLRGKPTTPVVDSPYTLANAKEHYSCPTMLGMELDDSGGEGTAGSHWSVRNARDDIMCGYVGPMMRYSAITIAAMEDLGFYKGNYAMAELLPWGYHSGCTLIDEKCVVNGVSNYPNMFCDNTQGSDGPYICSADLLGIGYCPTFTYTTSLPTYYQYFSNPRLGGGVTAEFCPIPTSYSNTGCATGSQIMMPLSLLADSSRCMTPSPGNSANGPICADVLCNSTASTYRVKFYGGQEFVDCPVGTTIDAQQSSSSFRRGSTYVCPPYYRMCIQTDGANLVENDDGASSTESGISAFFIASITLLFLLA